MDDNLKSVVLLAATITMGFVAGVFVLCQHTVMPGLARTDDRTFAGAFQAGHALRIPGRTADVEVAAT